MTRTLYPRSDSISAKVVAPSDFEDMFSSVIGNHIMNGFTVVAGSGLSVDVGTGKLRLNGLVVENDASENVASLTDNSTVHLYAQLARDGNSEAESWNFVTNTTGTLPTDAIKLAKITTSSGAVTAVSQVNQTDVKRYALLPTGSVQMYAGEYDNIPTGWLLCDGTAISRTTYKDLFDVVGTQFGVGDGSTTFNLPDLQAKFPRGAPASTSSGGTGGVDSVTLTENEMPSHSHSQSPHSHDVQQVQYSATSGAGGHYQINTTFIPNYSASPSYTSPGGANLDALSTTATNQSTGGGAAHENRPAFLELLYMIRV